MVPNKLGLHGIQEKFQYICTRIKDYKLKEIKLKVCNPIHEIRFLKGFTRRDHIGEGASMF